jgi:hypothetical protein
MQVPLCKKNQKRNGKNKRGPKLLCTLACAQQEPAQPNRVIPFLSPRVDAATAVITAAARVAHLPVFDEVKACPGLPSPLRLTLAAIPLSLTPLPSLFPLARASSSPLLATAVATGRCSPFRGVQGVRHRRPHWLRGPNRPEEHHGLGIDSSTSPQSSTPLQPICCDRRLPEHTAFPYKTSVSARTFLTLFLFFRAI